MPPKKVNEKIWAFPSLRSGRAFRGSAFRLHCFMLRFRQAQSTHKTTLRATTIPNVRSHHLLYRWHSLPSFCKAKTRNITKRPISISKKEYKTRGKIFKIQLSFSQYEFLLCQDDKENKKAAPAEKQKLPEKAQHTIKITHCSLRITHCELKSLSPFCDALVHSADFSLNALRKVSYRRVSHNRHRVKVRNNLVVYHRKNRLLVA